MSTSPPQDETGQDLTGPDHPTADLSELAATDALLDRLASRTATDDDLLDPTAAALSLLLGEIDAETSADSAMAHLVEVLAGRPLYIDGPSHQIGQIDLTTAEAEPADTAGTDVQKPVPQDPDIAAATPITAARSKRWRVAASKISAPVAAASIAVMVVLGGGVSAAVAGDPMAPLNGVGRVVAKLPGVDSSGYARKDAQKELELAASLAASDPDGALEHWNKAQAILADLPASKKSDLLAQADAVAQQLAPAEPGVPGATPVSSVTTPSDGVTSDPAVTGTPVTATSTDETSEPTTSNGTDGASTPPTSSTSTDPTATTGPTTTSAPGTSTDAPGTQTTAPSTQASAAPSTASSAASPVDSAPEE
ncbi:hypothetical protein GCM10022223_36280 [Kineosporia mesophila]|uniref:Anti-sigma-D factor RsdA sigma factor binding region domain-containing protein n=1 Tax=Kineosporia mesophila TaxID=566012 RepID=A0ABP6ZS82_9ACTN|nr:hypothetical protein [Kineosporia mesophila]MCD5349944.1 hypothetical protein [Kineosporia mesophila]